MQWSTVCRKWCQSAPDALPDPLVLTEMETKHETDLDETELDMQPPAVPHEVTPPSFGSQLLLQWAPKVRCLHLGDCTMQCKGLKAFMTAAVNLTEVAIKTVECKSELADKVLCASSSVLTISSKHSGHGFYMPSKLPQQLQQLTVCFGDRTQTLPHSGLQ